nr:MerR family transcriptional regulator [Bacillus pumilus]
MTQIAKQLSLAESTARFYRDRFENYIPSVGEGRKKRYKPETIEVLRFIAEGFNRNLTATDIEEGLSRMIARNTEFEEVTATAQQQSKNDPNHYALQLQIAIEQMSTAMQVIGNQKEEIAELRKHVAMIENKQQEQQEYINTKLEERDQMLMESIRGIQDIKTVNTSIDKFEAKSHSHNNKAVIDKFSEQNGSLIYGCSKVAKMH